MSPSTIALRNSVRSSTTSEAIRDACALCSSVAASKAALRRERSLLSRSFKPATACSDSWQPVASLSSSRLRGANRPSSILWGDEPSRAMHFSWISLCSAARAATRSLVLKAKSSSLRNAPSTHERHCRRVSKPWASHCSTAQFTSARICSSSTLWDSI